MLVGWLLFGEAEKQRGDYSFSFHPFVETKEEDML